jgi:lysozyme
MTWVNTARVSIVALTISGAALVGIAKFEGYTDKAIVPIPGDVPTKGFGTTKGVKLGDRTDPVRALTDLLTDANQFSAALKKCIDAPLYQHEFDAYSTLAYNVGAGAVCSSSIPRKLAAGDYGAACETILDFNGVCQQRNAAGRCIKKKIIQGLVNRRKAERDLCLGVGS